jgi:hypothetical protein
MALATLPPTIEIVEVSGANRPRHILSDPYWANAGLSDEPQWRSTAFWKISTLRAVGKNIPGLGDLRPSDQAVSELRKLLGKIQIQSLPLPVVSPVSGGAVFVSWKNGSKTVEVTAYHDGEVIFEGLDNQNLVEEVSKSDFTSVLNWLVQG